MKRVYLAGPEVFWPDARGALRRKSEITRQFGFDPAPPGDVQVPPGLDAHARGLHIGRENEKTMDGADFIIANLTPFRGPSADVGTAYEVGYMRGQGKKVFAYSDDARPYFVRLTEGYYAGAAQPDAAGGLRGPDGLRLEDHGMHDNLMLDTAALAGGGAFVALDGAPGEFAAFRACLAAAREWWAGR